MDERRSSIILDCKSNIPSLHSGSYLDTFRLAAVDLKFHKDLKE